LPSTNKSHAGNRLQPKTTCTTTPSCLSRARRVHTIHPDESDFTRGEAKAAPPAVALVFGNRPRTNEANGMAPFVQELYGGEHLQQAARAQGQAQLAPKRHRRQGRGGGGSGLTAKEEKVADVLRSLNRQERRRLAATRGILLKAPASPRSFLPAPPARRSEGAIIIEVQACVMRGSFVRVECKR
jgi:hypothetical protein